MHAYTHKHPPLATRATRCYASTSQFAPRMPCSSAARLCFQRLVGCGMLKISSGRRKSATCAGCNFVRCISEAKREQPERMLKHTLNRLPSLSWHVCLCRPAVSQRCKNQEGKSTPAFDCLVLGLVRAKFSAVCALTVSEWCILLSL
jgi:hypothetical protein